MSNDPSLIKSLFDKYARGTASPDEIKQLFRLISEGENDEEMKNALLEELKETGLQDDYDTERWNTVFNKVKAETELLEYENKPKQYFGFKRIAVAASIIFCLSIGGYFLFHKQQPQQIAYYKNDVKPGGNKAILTLSNGQQISLMDAKSGILASQGKTTIRKTTSGEVVYDAAHSASSKEIAYNTISTPRAGKWNAVLPDGSKVWLDAASSIRFPTAFTGKDRTVELTGQAYFEVVHNAAKPFHVTVKGQTIEDIGTHFNINAYDDEPVIKTTLLEGSIRIAKGGNKSILKPGQQAITRPNSDGITVKDIDTEEAIAWKNGYFLFNEESLQSVMRKVSRWYDVDVEYAPGQQISDNFLGSMTRYSNVSQVLNMLETAGHVKFEIIGRKILVTKK